MPLMEWPAVLRNAEIQISAAEKKLPPPVSAYSAIPVCRRPEDSVLAREYRTVSIMPNSAKTAKGARSRRKTRKIRDTVFSFMILRASI